MKELIYLAFLSIATAQLCPPDDVLYPCSCWERWGEIVCHGLERDFDLKGHFDNVSSHVGEDVVFQTLYINATHLEEIKEGTVEHLKFTRLDISLNFELRYISPRAFGASRNIVTDIYFWNNAKLVDVENTFEFVRSMQAVEVINLLRSGISSIPSNAFQNMVNLSRLFIEDNNISEIGGQAFSGVPELNFLLIQEYSIRDGRLNQNAFDGISSMAEVRLNNKRVTFLDKDTYQPLLDQASKVHLGEYVQGQRFYCNDRADWICEGQERYRAKLSGFNCMTTEQGYADIWEYCEGRNTSTRYIY